MANNQEILAHFMANRQEASEAFSIAQSNLSTLKAFLGNTDSFTSLANTTKKEAIKHSGCSICDSWS